MGWEGGVGRGVGLEGAGGDTGGEGLWDAGREVGAQGWKKGAGGERTAAVLTLRRPPPPLPNSQPRPQGPNGRVRIRGNKTANESFAFLAQEEGMSRHV